MKYKDCKTAEQYIAKMVAAYPWREVAATLIHEKVE